MHNPFSPTICRLPILPTSDHRFWQVVPHKDVAAGYLASLPTASALLAVLRSAHRARMRILGGALHTQQAEISLLRPDLKVLPHGLGCISCWEVVFSSCGLYMALSVMASRNASVFADTVLQHDQGKSARGVMIFRAGQEFTQTFFRYSPQARSPVMQWAAHKPHLSIALLPDLDGDMLANHKRYSRHDPRDTALHLPSVFAVDAPTGDILYALGPGNNWALQELIPDTVTLQWSASGQLLLLVSCSEATGLGASPDASHQVQGAIWVFDVWQDRLCACSKLFGHSLSEELAPAIWCPACPDPGGLVLSNGVSVDDPASFAQAGFAMGTLPDKCFFVQAADCVPATAVSPDGQRLIAHCSSDSDWVSEDSWDDWPDSSQRHPEREFRILRFRVEGQDITWDSMDTHLLEGHGCSWVSSSSVVTGMYMDYWEECETVQPSKIVSIAGAGGCVQLQGLPLASKACGAPACSSASALFIADSADGPRILSTESGEQLWAPSAGVTSEAKLGSWTELLAFLPSASGVVCARPSFCKEGTATILGILLWA